MDMWRTHGVIYTPAIPPTTARGVLVLISENLGRGLANLNDTAIKSIDANLTPPSELGFPYDLVTLPFRLFAIIVGEESWSLHDLPHPFYQDDDEGPSTIWKRVFPAAVDGGSVDSGFRIISNQLYFRRMAWVMWDGWRLGITAWEDSVSDYDIRALVMNHPPSQWYQLVGRDACDNNGIPRVHRCRDCRGT